MDVVHAAEVNTWPHIPRIRAHCLVEMTLDRCVQKLRKRLSDQSHLAHEAALKNLKNSYNNLNRLNGSSNSSDSNNRYQQYRDMFKRDSFYTTQSLVNLSG